MVYNRSSTERSRLVQDFANIDVESAYEQQKGKRIKKNLKLLSAVTDIKDM